MELYEAYNLADAARKEMRRAGLGYLGAINGRIYDVPEPANAERKVYDLVSVSALRYYTGDNGWYVHVSVNCKRKAPKRAASILAQATGILKQTLGLTTVYTHCTHWGARQYVTTAYLEANPRALAAPEVAPQRTESDGAPRMSPWAMRNTPYARCAACDVCAKDHAGAEHAFEWTHAASEV